MRLKKSFFVVLISTLSFFSNYSLANASNVHPSYEEVFKSHQDHASDKWLSYFEVYDRSFQKFIGKKPNVLEVGVQNGGNLQVLSKYFQNANIYGVDIDQNVCNLKLGKNIHTFCFDATKKDIFHKTFDDKTFDVIIDDGSHVQKDIIMFFEHAFYNLAPNGVFLIEDLHTSYWKDYGGGFKEKDSAIEYFKRLVDLVNIQHMDKSISQNFTPFEKYVASWIDRIEFTDSIVVIFKKSSVDLKVQRIAVGTKEPVAPTITTAKKHGYYYQGTEK